jgi:ferrous iron transport protein A
MSGVGETGVVVRISGREDIKRFLNGLGFIPGARVSTVSTNGGNVILDLMGSRIAIDRTMASRIMFNPER